MIKFKVSGIDRLKKKFDKLNSRELYNAPMLLSLGRLMRDIIYKRTKAGYGVTSIDSTVNVQKEKLAALSPSYIATRKGELAFFTSKLGNIVPYKPKRKPRLGEFGTPSKSNLTFTGQMLDAINYRLTRQGVEIYVNKNRREEGGLTNAKVADYVQQNGRLFFNLTQAELNILIREIEKELRKITRRFS